MILIGNTKKMIMGGWILASLFGAAYNGFQLAPLFSSPVAGYSDEVRAVISKRHSLEAQVLAARSSVRQVDLAALTAGVDRPPVTKEDRNAEPPSSLASGVDTGDTETEPPLPQLQGIFRNVDIHGNVTLRAILDGKMKSEKDRLGRFSVNQISDKGVLLTKDERSWFLQLPDVPFCFTRKE
jgi:hypothetical protein